MMSLTLRVCVSGVVYEQCGTAGGMYTSQAPCVQAPCPPLQNAPQIHSATPVPNLQPYVAPMPQVNPAQSHQIPVAQSMTGHVDGSVTARASPGVLRPTPYYNHPIAYAAPQMMVPAQALVPLTYVPANGTVPTNVMAVPWKPYTVMMPVSQQPEDVARYGPATIAVSSPALMQPLKHGPNYPLQCAKIRVLSRLKLHLKLNFKVVLTLDDHS